MSYQMPDRERDDDTGRYTDKYPPEVVLDAIRAVGGAAATSEVADELGADRNTAYKKLRLMEERGQVTSRRAGGIRIWSVGSDGTAGDSGSR